MTQKKIMLVSAIFIMLILSGCGSLEKGEAESIAKTFVERNVGFYAKDQGTPVTLPNYEIVAKESFKEGGNWIVIVHISSEINNETKKNDVAVKVDNAGKVIEFNGAKIGK